VKWIAIDEIHLVSVWGRDFRKSYALLEGIRHILGNKPWFGYTATLDQPTFTRVCDYAAFRSTTKVMRLSTDRPNIAIVRARLKRHDKKSYKMLHFVVAEASKRSDGSLSHGFSQLRDSDGNINNQTRDGTTLTESQTQRSLIYTPYKPSSLRWAEAVTPETYNQSSRTVKGRPRTTKIGGSDTLPPPADLKPSPECIPKTLIFTDSRDGCCSIVNSIRAWLQRLGYSETLSRETIKPYYSTLIDADKAEILSRFAEIDTGLRILVATDALAHGKDVPDIDIVIIYGMPRDKDQQVSFGKCLEELQEQRIARAWRF
jgi:superfamily II DNA helicase RecQ